MRKILILILLFLMTYSVFSATDESVCATLVVTQIKTVNPQAQDAQLIPFWTAICKGILDHLKTSADVVPGTFQDAESRPITGTGKIQ